MSFMDELLKKAFANVDSSHEQTRQRIFNEARAALDRHGKAKNWDEKVLSVRKQELEEAIDRYRTGLSKSNSDGVSIMDGNQESNAATSQGKSGAKMALFGFVLLALGGFGAYSMVAGNSPTSEAGDSSSVKVGENAQEPAQNQASSPTASGDLPVVGDVVQIDLGGKVVAKGNAVVSQENGQIRISDQSAEENSHYQWMVDEVESNQTHSISAAFVRRTDYAGWLQLQVYYSAGENEVRNYVWLANLENGKLVPQLDAPMDSARLSETEGGWLFEATTRSPQYPSSMQMIVFPAIGGDPTGTVIMSRLSASKTQ